jgi:hypothetical protein
MKHRTLYLSACLVLAAISVAWAADLNGKWVAQVPGRNGQTRETTFNFKVEGSKLTGTVSGMQGDNPISEGSIKGNDVSFIVTANFNGNQVKLIYKGTLAGDELKLTRTREGGDQPGQEFTAKRVK